MTERRLEKYLQVYFQAESNYYSYVYLRYLNGKKITFNLMAFFIGFFWMLYRKLYVQGLIYILTVVLMFFGWQFLIKKYQLEDQVVLYAFYGMNLLFSLFTGFVGNYIYMRHMEKNLEAVLVKTANEEERIAQLNKKGGVSVLSFFIALLFWLFYMYKVNNAG